MRESYSDRAQDIEHPTCAACGSSMSLARIEPFDADHDQRTFECKACGKTKIEIVTFR
jgi:transposase-like protein